jgi:hypothetical protein
LNPSGAWQTILTDFNTGLEGVLTVGTGWAVYAVAPGQLVGPQIGPFQGVATGLSYNGGTSAEWIVEDPTNGATGSLISFANFGTVTFTNLTTSVPGWSIPFSSGFAIDQKGAILAQPTGVGNNSFNVSYL